MNFVFSFIWFNHPCRKCANPTMIIFISGYYRGGSPQLYYFTMIFISEYYLETYIPKDFRGYQGGHPISRIKRAGHLNITIFISRYYLETYIHKVYRGESFHDKDTGVGHPITRITGGGAGHTNYSYNIYFRVLPGNLHSKDCRGGLPHHKDTGVGHPLIRITGAGHLGSTITIFISGYYLETYIHKDYRGGSPQLNSETGMLNIEINFQYSSL